MRKLVILTLGALLIATMWCDSHATTIEIASNSFLSPFGEPDSGQSGFATVAQVFRITPGGPHALETVNFSIPHSYGDDVDFTFYLYDVRPATCLFTSNEILTSSPTNGIFSVDLGGIELDPGKYVWIVSASGFFDDDPGTSSIPVNTTNPYRGGFLVYANTGDDFNTLFNEQGRWNRSVITRRRDLDFASSMVIHAPEPCTLFLLGSGLAGLAAVRRKFKK